MTLEECDRLFKKGFNVTVKRKGKYTYVVVGKEVQ